MVIETKVVIGWFKLQFRMWLVDYGGPLLS